MAAKNERDAVIVAAATSGESHLSVAKRYGISRQRISQICAAAGVKHAREVLSDTDVDRITNLYESGVPITHVALMVGASTRQTLAVLVRCGKWKRARAVTRWTNAEESVIRNNYGRGMTASDIGHRLGRSKCEIIGKAWRMGLSGRKIGST